MADSALAFYNAYLDNLEEIDRLNAALRQAYADLDAANAEAYIGIRVGNWGTAIRRLSELEDLWDTKMRPLLDAAGMSMRPPWERIARHGFIPEQNGSQPPTIKGYEV